MKISQCMPVSALFIANANIIACLCELGKQFKIFCIQQAKKQLVFLL